MRGKQLARTTPLDSAGLRAPLLSTARFVAHHSLDCAAIGTLLDCLGLCWTVWVFAGPTGTLLACLGGCSAA